MRSRLLLAMAAFAMAVSTTPAHAQFVFEAHYTGGGTVVVKQQGQAPAADEGVLACDATDGQGVGGACVSFGSGSLTSVSVQDDAQGRSVAFQVCIDNDGNGLCVFPDSRQCGDDVFFSHSDTGQVFNPLGPLPGRHRDGCPGGVWDGYVVFLCTGVHDSGGAHAHPATTGTVRLAGDGTGFGNFCGGTPVKPTTKRYVVVR